MGPAVLEATPAPGALRLAGHHFTLATIFLVAGSIGLIWISPQLAAGQYLSPHVVAVTHLFTLGWITISIFGALCQFLPVALGTPLKSPAAAHLALTLLAPGVALFAVGVATVSSTIRIIGLVLLAAGILIMAVNLYGSLLSATQRDATWAGIAMAVTFLVTTLALGVTLALNLDSGFIQRDRLRVLASHLHVALAGWVLTMIIAVSHRLLPMFMLAHGGNRNWTARALTGIGSGVVLLPIGILFDLTPIRWLGAAALIIGLGCFVTQVRAFHKARIKRVLDSGIRFAMTAVGFLMAAALLGLSVLVFGIRHNRLATIYILAGLLGGLTLYVVGFYYKIVPLLAWTWRYRSQMGRATVPTVAQMFSAPLANTQLRLMGSGVVVIGIGIALSLAPAALAGGVMFAAGSTVFAAQLVRIAVGRPLPATASQPHPEPN